jgi:hypothetical protein
MSTTLTFDKIRCVTYKDEFSIDGSSYNDLLVSIEQKVVGCGSSVFGASKKGDIVIICANKGKEKYFTIGVLDRRLTSCSEWHIRGGREWEHNFTWIQLCPLIKKDLYFDHDFVEICNKHGLKWQYMFNSRLCGIRYKPVLEDLLVLIKNRYGFDSV